MILGTSLSVKGVPIRLTEERWEHILDNHAEFSFSDQNENHLATMKISDERRRTTLMDLACKRVQLPEVPVELDYQDDIDTLCIRFGQPVDFISFQDRPEDGVVGLYEGEKLVGVEILDITDQMDAKLIALSQQLHEKQLVP